MPNTDDICRLVALVVLLLAWALILVLFNRKAEQIEVDPPVYQVPHQDYGGII